MYIHNVDDSSYYMEIAKRERGPGTVRESTPVRKYIHTYTRTLTNKCIHVYVYVYTHTYIYIYIYIYVYICIYIYVCPCVYMYIHTHNIPACCTHSKNKKGTY